MFKTTVIMIGLAFGMFSSQSRATTYYLDSASGNDFNAGTQASSPWKTLQYASSKLYHPRDQILLKAGSVWKGETLKIVVPDATGDPTTVSSYGAGNQPVLDGASKSTPLILKNDHNVNVTNLKFQNAGTLISVIGGSNIIISGCTLADAFTFGVNVSQTTAFTFSNNTYTNTGTSKLIGAALRVVALVDGVTVTGNAITFNQASNSPKGIYILDVNNAVVAGNTVSGGSQGIGIKGLHRSVTGAQIYNNAVYNIDSTAGDGESIEFTGWTNTSFTASGSIHHNFMKGGPNTINAIGGYQCTNVAVYNNIVIGPFQNSAFHWTSKSLGASFYGNTIHNVPIAFAIFSGSSADIRNNIVSKADVVLSVDSSKVDSSKVTEDYNVFFDSGRSGVARGAHTDTADPQFISANPAGPLDVELQLGSPAIHSGSPLNSAYNLALDPASSLFASAMLDQSIWGWNRGAFGSR